MKDQEYNLSKFGQIEIASWVLTQSSSHRWWGWNFIYLLISLIYIIYNKQAKDNKDYIFPRGLPKGSI